MAARIIALCDELVTKVVAAWPAMTNEDTAKRAYVAPVALDKATPFAGRHVWVFPGTYQDEAATRGEKNRGFAVETWVAERYPDGLAAESDAARDWFDARVEFVETLYDALDFGQRTKTGLLSFGSRVLWTESALAVTYDGEHLAGKKLFVASIESTLREIA